MIFVAVFDTIFVAVFDTILIVVFIIRNNAGKITGILRLFKSNYPYCSFQPASKRTYVLLASPSQ